MPADKVRWTPQEIEARYRDRAVVDGDVLYFSVPVASRFVADCIAHDLAVLGIEGFYREADGLRVSMDLIRDYGNIEADSWEEYSRVANESATRFLCDLDKTAPILVNLVLWSREDWQQKRQ